MIRLKNITIVRKLFILIGLCCFNTVNTLAQSTFHIHVGAMADNMDYTSNVPGVNPSDGYLKIGYHVSLDIKCPVSDRAAFFIEPGYITKGAKTSTVYDISINLNMATLPVIFSYRILDQVALEIGPEFNYLLSANTKENGTKSITTDFYNNRFEISGLGSATYAINDNIYLGATYSIGLTPINKYVFYDISGNAAGVIKQFTRYAELFVRIGL